MRDRLPLQHGDAAADGGAWRRSAHDHHAVENGRIRRRPHRFHPRPVRRRRSVRVAEPVRQPKQLEGALRHHSTAIVRQFPRLDVLFVGAGTTGTLMGCARYLRDWHRHVRVVAVDAVGSVTFGRRPGRRMIPGLGTSLRPSLLDDSFVDEVVLVEEPDAIRACHRLARHGFLSAVPPAP